ncbi:MAG: LicD family protein [Eubacterium sp.]|nr:LicD family protein [Eubacterium sp.]
MKDHRNVLKKGFDSNDKVIKLHDDGLKKMQSILLMMLKDFDAIARKYNIEYTLSGGSVIGALRHGGFIPWDDDIDINVTRKNYEKLKKVFKNYKGSKYKLYVPEECPGHGMSLPQIKLNGTIYKSFIEISKEDEDCGICLDIFVIENTYNNPVLRSIHGVGAYAFGYLLTCIKTYHDIEYLKPYLTDKEAAKAFKKKARIGRLFRFISLDTAVRWTVKWFAKCKDDSSKYVTIPSGRGHFFKEMCERDEIAYPTEIKFAGMDTFVATGADAYMKRLYGENYMTPPPPEKREQHPIMALDFGKY